MPQIVSVSTFQPPYLVSQKEAMELSRSLFTDRFKDIERLLKVFQNGDIEERHVCMPLDWYGKPHDFEERNNLYITHAVDYGTTAITDCLQSSFLEKEVQYNEIDAIIFVSSTGIATPSIEARIMNRLPFRDDVKRIPLWGLGCAGGASGLSRAFEFCKAYPEANVLVLTIELCSLTFQQEDYSKSNLVGVSLFSDGVACALVTGTQSSIRSANVCPSIVGTTSKLMPNSEEVMGWDVKNNGLYVVFSKSIPSIITSWFGPFVHQFLKKYEVTVEDISHFVAHPGGKKVLQAYETALRFDSSMTTISRNVLRMNGNMSSPTVLYVLKEYMEAGPEAGDYGILAALGPGFSGELQLLRWE